MGEKLDKLTMKQEIFCQEWVDSLGNGTKAALKAFDIKDNNEETASSMAYEYLRKPEINKRIDEILDERGFNDETVKKEHFKMVKQDSDYGVKMRAISDFYKLKGKYLSPDEPASEKVITINIIAPDGTKHKTYSEAV